MDEAEDSLGAIFKELESRLNAPQYDVAPLTRIVESSIQALTQVKIALNKQNERFEKDRAELLKIAKNLQEREQALKKKEEELKIEEKKIADVVIQSQDQVTLNVGGKLITTSKKTLISNPDSMLGAMFSGRFNLKPDADGSYFIDRDPTYFSHVLNYLRDGKIRLPPNDDVKDEEGVSVRSRILAELDYFCIPLKGILKSTNFIQKNAFLAHDDKIRTMKIHNNTSVTGGDDGYIKFIDLATAECYFEFHNSGNVERLDYDGNLLAASIRNEEKDEFLKVWKMDTKDCLYDQKKKSPIYWVKLQKQKLITCGYEIQVYDTATMNLIQEFGKKQNLISWCMDSNENSVTTGQNDGTIALWDLRTSSHINTIKGHDDGVNDIKIVGDDIISGGSDSVIKIFDMKTMRCKNVLDAHLKSIFSLAVIENMLVSASCDKTVRLWELETGECCKTLYGNQRAVSCVGVCGTDMIISGAWDGSLRIWSAQ